MTPLLLATNNPGKLLEIQDLLPAFELVLPRSLGIDLEVEETGLTYAQNAGLKAEAFCRASGLVSLADDSGLEVDSLGGLPGLQSHRYSPLPDASDADRRVLLLRNLAAHPRPWLAHFHCTVAIATPGPQLALLYTEGDCPGEIIPDERGSNGFGYDPIFLLPELGLTMAELSRAQKNRLSHRARAVTAALPLLSRLLKRG
jgi:XTP/dITP diphosphohydrolase